MSPLSATLLLRLMALARFALNEGCTYPSLWYMAGRALERLGGLGAAASAYGRALKAAETSGNRRMFRVRQKWQFRREHVFHQLGRARVHDPLFACRIALPAGPRAPARPAPGHFTAEWSYRGLMIYGVLTRPTTDRCVRVVVDGRLMREVTCATMGPVPPYFQITLSRAAIGRLPPTATLRVETGDGDALRVKGRTEVLLHVPHGNGALRSSRPEQPFVDKKGFLISTDESLEQRQRAFLEIYTSARRFFEREFDRPLLLLYGTLLGVHRQGDFIPGDDDFDVGYVSSECQPEAVKQEAMRIVQRLVLGGFVVSFNRSGRLFRLRRPQDPPHVHLDVHPTWFRDGWAWLHPKARLACSREDFLPARATRLQGVEVLLPRTPEAFLSTYYGPNWRTPDPTYSNAARKVPREVRRELERALVTPRDVASLKRACLDADPGAAALSRLIPIGTYSLYPLEDYDARCDW